MAFENIENTFPADKVHGTLSKYMLVDGFDLVVDLKKSSGSYLVDAKTGKRYVDLFSYFASAPLGHNPVELTDKKFLERISYVAISKPSNSDMYTAEMAEFVETFGKLARPEYMKYLFFISGGALAVENALKAAFDWKVRKNIAAGRGEELGYQIIHFQRAFHGRSGYTLSLTNTFDKRKTKYFPKFDWPRIDIPKLSFPLTDKVLQSVIENEKLALAQIEQAVRENPNDIAALIIEPIQGEGGDNHFRPEFMQELRKLADKHEFLFIVDEVQSGMGITGKMWAHQWHDVQPDIVVFGKKSQICGFMSGERLDEVHDNVFRESSRINSTWGGSLVDMVRSQKYLEIIARDQLVEYALSSGDYFKSGLQSLAEKYSHLISNVRGKGLMIAFDFPTTDKRDQFAQFALSEGLLLLKSGEFGIRFRPALNIPMNVIDEALEIIDKALARF